MTDNKQTCVNCKMAEVRTQIGQVIMDWKCQLKPAVRITRYSQACLMWKSKEVKP